MRINVFVLGVVVVAAAGVIVQGKGFDKFDKFDKFNIFPSEPEWTVGQYAQVTLAVLESALLTLVLVFPSVMDPIVEFLNKFIGGVGSRRRRDVQSMLTDRAGALHDLLLNAVDTFQDLDETLANMAP